MSPRTLTNRRGWIGTALLVGSIVTAGAALTAWKLSERDKSEAAAASQPEPTETITAALATEREHRPTTTAVGTVLAMRSITLRNEIAGTVHRVALTPGDIVEKGALLVALDVSVETAELEAQAAQAALAQTTLARLESLRRHEAVSQEEVDQARAARDVAQAEIARTKAIIARKTIRAPFRVRVGIADVHPGQYLNEGTELTTLQGIADAAHVDFSVAQRVAAGLKEGDKVAVVGANEAAPIAARIAAVDSRVDPATRNASVRATISGAGVPAPGASVRVLVPMGAPRKAVAVPVSALRKGPGGDHVFAITPDKEGKLRAHVRQVQSGPVVGDEVIIQEGLKPGERVATSGSFKLREAVLVAVADSAAAGAAPAGSK